MRKIEERMLKAFKKKRNWRERNTQVIVTPIGVTVWLYHHCIAKTNINNEVKYSFGGYNSATTRSRLRALGCNVSVKKGFPYRDGKVWFGDF